MSLSHCSNLWRPRVAAGFASRLRSNRDCGAGFDPPKGNNRARRLRSPTFIFAPGRSSGLGRVAACPFHEFLFHGWRWSASPDRRDACRDACPTLSMFFRVMVPMRVLAVFAVQGGADWRFCLDSILVSDSLPFLITFTMRTWAARRQFSGKPICELK